MPKMYQFDIVSELDNLHKRLFLHWSKKWSTIFVIDSFNLSG